MKYLFLDFDGVLNSHQNQCQVKYNITVPDRIVDSYKVMFFLDPAKVALLAKIVEKTGCHIVVISTWRNHFDIELIRAYFKQVGFPFVENIHSNADTNFIDREDAITEFMKNNNMITYCVLDDSRHKRIHHSCQVNPSFDDGLTRAQADKVIEILNAFDKK